MQRDPDREQLNLLAVFYYVLAAITGFFACFPLIHVAFGIAFIMDPGGFAGPQQEAPPEWFGAFFALIGGVFVLIGWSVAFCMFLTGRFLTQTKNWMFCIVIAAVACMLFPLGTVLGVFTLIVLNRPSVRSLFEAAPHEFADDGFGRPDI